MGDIWNQNSENAIFLITGTCNVLVNVIVNIFKRTAIGL